MIACMCMLILMLTNVLKYKYNYGAGTEKHFSIGYRTLSMYLILKIQTCMHKQLEYNLLQ